MKAQIPSLNIIVSLLYLTLAGATMFLLKLASKPLPPLQPTKKQNNPERTQKIYRRMATSWLKKYSIVGTMMFSDRKYLAKELLIISVYGVACLKINRITLWPVALLTFLLPAIFLIYEMALKLQRSSQSSEQQAKNVNEVQLELQYQGADDRKVKSVHQGENKAAESKGSRNFCEIGTISIIVFIGVVLDIDTIMVLDSSTSNAGQLNIISVLCIVLLDQLLLRPISGLLLIGTVKLLQWRQIIQLHQNKLVALLCEQLLLEQQALEQWRMAFERTQAHLKQKEENLRDTNVPIKPDRGSMVQIDFQQIQPFEKKPAQSPHKVLRRSLGAAKQQEVYLTTPQKEMFEAGCYSSIEQSILKKYISNKQNAQNNTQPLHQLNRMKENSCFDELVLTNGHHPFANLQSYYRNAEEIQNYVGEPCRKKTLDKGKNRRILKLTGNSPYLEYLPNMLKNVRKTAQTSGVGTAPKLAQLNLR